MKGFNFAFVSVVFAICLLALANVDCMPLPEGVEDER